jgi:hypothetical protein
VIGAVHFYVGEGKFEGIDAFRERSEALESAREIVAVVKESAAGTVGAPGATGVTLGMTIAGQTPPEGCFRPAWKRSPYAAAHARSVSARSAAKNQTQRAWLVRLIMAPILGGR